MLPELRRSLEKLGVCLAELVAALEATGRWSATLGAAPRLPRCLMLQMGHSAQAS